MKQDITIDSERLSAEIDKLALISDAPAPAVTRILFTDRDLEGRAYVKTLAEEAGLTIREDALGNMFLRWEGTEPDLPAVATGSHIDAIPFSGKYDGVVGVLGPIEAIRALKRAAYVPRRSIEVISFTAEEPTRFGIGCLGSRAMCGQLQPVDLLKLKDSEGEDLDSIRTAAGYSGDLGAVRLSKGHYAAFVELHIEQGPRLEEAGLDIGVVKAIAAPATLRVRLTGDGGHAGAVLMPGRRDALLPAAEITIAVDRIARESTSHDSVATTGLLQVHPGAVNSIPSEVVMEIDIRDTHQHTRDQMVKDIYAEVQRSAAKRKVSEESEVLNADPPATCDARIIQTINQAADDCSLSHTELVSRAYHDSLFMAQICPTAMIFVPSFKGYSHRPEEYTSPEEIANGVKVLARVLEELAG